MTEQNSGLPELLASCMTENATVIWKDDISTKEVHYRVVRVQLQGIARFACWWFVIVSSLSVVWTLLTAK
jgi:hypothetical protein